MSIPPAISDDAVRAKTGKDWQTWFEILDTAGAQSMDHKQMVAFLQEHYPVEPWWQQSIVVTYEKTRGLRQMHEKPDGFQVSRSKTLPVPQETLFAAWQDPEQRRQWLPDPDLEIRRQTPHKSIRAGWIDGQTSLDIYIYTKGERKSQVTVQHNRLDNGQRAEEMKAYWTDALERLESFLASHD